MYDWIRSGLCAASWRRRSTDTTSWNASSDSTSPTFIITMCSSRPLHRLRGPGAGLSTGPTASCVRYRRLVSLRVCRTSARATSTRSHRSRLAQRTRGVMRTRGPREIHRGYVAASAGVRHQRAVHGHSRENLVRPSAVRAPGDAEWVQAGDFQPGRGAQAPYGRKKPNLRASDGGGAAPVVLRCAQWRLGAPLKKRPERA
jgi:hypothetical protein